MTSLRLAIITRRFWPLAGSVESVLGALAAELAAQACAVRILTPRWRPSWPVEIRWRDVVLERLPPPADRGRSMGGWLRAIQIRLRAESPRLDLVYVSALRQEAAAAIKALGRRRPVVLRAERAGRQGDCLWQIETPGGRRIKQQCLQAAALVAPTPVVRRELEAAGYPRSRIHEVLDGSALPPSSAAKQTARNILADCHNLLQLTPHAPLVVCLGRLAAGRGLESLLDAWVIVSGQRPDARLWLVGDTSAGAPLRERIARLGLFGRAMVAGMFDDIEEVLAAADVLVAPSPLGAETAVREGMAAGLPVVAGDVAANRWLIDAGRDGLLVPPENVTLLAEALLGVLAEPERAARLGTAARQRAAQRCSLARMVQEHLTLFHKLSSSFPGEGQRFGGE